MKERTPQGETKLYCSLHQCIRPLNHQGLFQMMHTNPEEF
jgi:hypothetical protein